MECCSVSNNLLTTFLAIVSLLRAHCAHTHTHTIYWTSWKPKANRREKKKNEKKSAYNSIETKGGMSVNTMCNWIWSKMENGYRKKTTTMKSIVWINRMTACLLFTRSLSCCVHCLPQADPFGKRKFFFFFYIFRWFQFNTIIETRLKTFSLWCYWPEKSATCDGIDGVNVYIHGGRRIMRWRAVCVCASVWMSTINNWLSTIDINRREKSTHKRRACINYLNKRVNFGRCEHSNTER